MAIGVAAGVVEDESGALFRQGECSGAAYAPSGTDDYKCLVRERAHTTSPHLAALRHAAEPTLYVNFLFARQS